VKNRKVGDWPAENNGLMDNEIFGLAGIDVFCSIMGLRQEKFARQIQRDLGEIFQHHRQEWLANEFVTISGVKVTPDLGLAKVYLSILNIPKRKQVMENLTLYGREIRMELARKLKNQVRKIPEITFYEDDSLDYVSKMDKIFEELNKGKINPDKESDS
jgi:ribosome-binding factor A